MIVQKWRIVYNYNELADWTSKGSKTECEIRKGKAIFILLF